MLVLSMCPLCYSVLIVILLIQLIDLLLSRETAWIGDRNNLLCSALISSCNVPVSPVSCLFQHIEEHAVRPCISMLFACYKERLVCHGLQAYRKTVLKDRLVFFSVVLISKMTRIVSSGMLTLLNFVVVF